MRIKGVALKTAGLYPDAPGVLGRPNWDKQKLRDMNQAALCSLAKWHPGRLKAAQNQNRMMDEGSQRHRA